MSGHCLRKSSGHWHGSDTFGRVGLYAGNCLSVSQSIPLYALVAMPSARKAVHSTMTKNLWPLSAFQLWPFQSLSKHSGSGPRCIEKTVNRFGISRRR